LNRSPFSSKEGNQLNSTSNIRECLESIGAVSSENIRLLSSKTRDLDVPVFVDVQSGVIFIEDFYVGLTEYSSENYREPEPPWEDHVDTRRRLAEHGDLIFNKRIVDFGFGAGTFLTAAAEHSQSAIGVELGARARSRMSERGIKCFADIRDVVAEIDTVFGFHVVEHLSDPLGVLKTIREKLLTNSGTLVVEVPHARDLLLSTFRSADFQEHALWSQHLVLHTRDSLRRLLVHAGFSVQAIYGLQRYGLPNHFGWLHQHKPGLHKELPYRILNSAALHAEYEKSLLAIDSTDTIVALATAV
jgi:hypothetical protein